MENKTFGLIFIFLAVIALFGIIIISLFQTLSELDAKMEAEARDLAINASWDEGWDLGYAWGAYDIFEEVMLKGFFAHNETWVLYSPEGCGAAFTAEIETQGCEVRCP